MATLGQYVGAGIKAGSLGIGQFSNDLSGATLTNSANAAQAQLDREYNAQEAERQRQHELYMSNTAYQRAVQDMRAAGINPASLSGLVGDGQVASSSSSSSASSSGPARFSHSSKSPIVDLISGLVTTAVKAGVRIGISAMD